MSILESIYRELLLRKSIHVGYKVTGVLMPGAVIERVDKNDSYCEIDNSDKSIIVFLCIESGSKIFDTFNSNDFLKELGLSVLIANECDILVSTYIPSSMSILYRIFLNVITSYGSKKISVLESCNGIQLMEASRIYKLQDIIDFTRSFSSDTSNEYVLNNLVDIIKTGSKPNLFIADNMKDSAYDLNESIREMLLNMLYKEEDYLENINNDNLILIPYFDDCSSLKMRKTVDSSNELYKIGKGIYSMANKNAIVFGSHWNSSLYTTIVHYIAHAIGIPTIII